MTTPRIARAATLALAALAAPSTHAAPPDSAGLELGLFSVSLTVKDIRASKAFYEKLDFRQVGGQLEKNWVVLQNGEVRIGLFQGLFEKNLLTFNPGWNKDKQALKDFQDVRQLQRRLREKGIQPVARADEAGSGPAYFTITDPDGNTLLFDQHVASPSR